MLQARTREQLAAAHGEVDSFRSQVEVSHAKLQRLERSNAHLRKQRAQMMADLQVRTLATLFAASPAQRALYDIAVQGLQLYMYRHSSTCNSRSLSRTHSTFV